MFNMIIYSLIIILVVSIAAFGQYTFHKPKSHQKLYDKEPTKQIKKTPTLNIFLIAFILSLYSAYFSTSGYLADTNRYAWSFLYRYPAYYESLDTLLNSGTELGFLIINMFINYFTNNPYWLFLFVAFITTYINLYAASKISKNYVLLVFLYLTSLYFFYTTYLLRQALAVSFINLAYVAYLKDQKTKYFLNCIIALTFHVTSIIMIPLFFIFNRIKSMKEYIFIIATFTIIFISFGSIFNTVLPKLPFIDQFLDFENMELATGGGSLSSVLKGIPFYFITMLALLRRNKLKLVMDNTDFYVLCSVFYSLSWLLTYNMYWFFRIGMYFLLPTLAIVPSLFGTIKNQRKRILYYIIFIFILIIITFRQMFITLQ